jgi:peptidoglycan pentaglycine glycine transferase (the first glycine)
MKLEEIQDPNQWDGLICSMPGSHPLQLWGWGELKRTGGWWPYRLVVRDGSRVIAAAQMLMLPIPGLLGRAAYVPRGPIMDPSGAHSEEAMGLIAQFARSQRALFLTIEPGWEEYSWSGRWHESRERLLVAKTGQIDLAAARKGSIRTATATRQKNSKNPDPEFRHFDDGSMKHFDDFWRIYPRTARLARLGVHAKEYYQKLLSTMDGHLHQYYASSDGQVRACLWVAVSGANAFELYGGVSDKYFSSPIGAQLRAHALKHLQGLGVELYDLNGLLDAGTLGSKAEFSPRPVMLVGSYDLAFNPGRYNLWHSVLPVAKRVGRRVRRIH